MHLFPEQQKAYDLILEGKNVFITGSSGTGKSSIIKKYIQEMKYNNKFAVTSTTGTSALIIGGVTLHSYLGIGLGKSSVEVLFEKINTKKWLKKKWIDINTIIIDEISMLCCSLFDKLEHLARLIRRNDEPFGGIQLILTGDFLQLPPVKSVGFCFEAKSWNECVTNVVYLQKIIRQDNSIFQNCLNNVRLGILNEETINVLSSRENKILENDTGIIPTKLFSLRRDVAYINQEEINILAEYNDIYLYEMEVVILNSKKKSMLNNVKKWCNVEKSLELCIGAQVMLSKNIDFDSKLVNGSRGIVTGFTDDLPIVKFINGVTRKIDFEVWEIEDNDEKIFELHQLPLKLAFALSIHTCQGSTLDYVEIDLGDIFEYGQAYVALSRVKNLEGLSITNFTPSLIKSNPVALKYYEELK